MEKRRRGHTARGRPGLRNELRIIGGKWRGRHVQFPPLPQLRASHARVRQTLFNWIVTGAAAALNIGLNFALIPEYGQIGAGIATLAAYALMLVGMTWNAHRLFPVPYQWRRVVTVAGIAVGLTVLGKELDVGLAVAIALVAVYPLLLALAGFYLPAERRMLRRMLPAR